MLSIISPRYQDKPISFSNNTFNMAKIKIWESDLKYMIFFCPGCGKEHMLSPTIHSWNGDVDRPTITPSVLFDWESGADSENGILIKGSGKANICHSFIRDGYIQFLVDCTHHLAGVIECLPDIKYD